LAEGRDPFNSGGKVRGREGKGNDQRKTNKVTIISNIFNKKKKKKRTDKERNKVKA